MTGSLSILPQAFFVFRGDSKEDFARSQIERLSSPMENCELLSVAMTDGGLLIIGESTPGIGDDIAKWRCIKESQFQGKFNHFNGE